MGLCWPAFVFPTAFVLANRIPAWRYPGWLILGSQFAGLNGYELAWMHRRFRSYADFRQTMAVWNTWARLSGALWITVLVVALVWAFVTWVFDDG